LNIQGSENAIIETNSLSQPPMDSKMQLQSENSVSYSSPSVEDLRITLSHKDPLIVDTRLVSSRPVSDVYNQLEPSSSIEPEEIIEGNNAELNKYHLNF
jgi:hypothetical protein